MNLHETLNTSGSLSIRIKLLPLPSQFVNQGSTPLFPVIARLPIVVRIELFPLPFSQGN